MIILSSLNTLIIRLINKYFMMICCVLSLTIFAQVDSIQVKGNLIGLDGSLVADKKIVLKEVLFETKTNEVGEFSMIVPKSMAKYTFALETDNFIKSEYEYKEIDLNQPITIKMKYLIQESDKGVQEEDVKPTFKQRVINTITWPYRKIRDTFFKND